MWTIPFSCWLWFLKLSRILDWGCGSGIEHLFSMLRPLGLVPNPIIKIFEATKCFIEDNVKNHYVHILEEKYYVIMTNCFTAAFCLGFFPSVCKWYYLALFLVLILKQTPEQIRNVYHPVVLAVMLCNQSVFQRQASEWLAVSRHTCCSWLCFELWTYGLGGLCPYCRLVMSVYTSSLGSWLKDTDLCMVHPIQEADPLPWLLNVELSQCHFSWWPEHGL